MVIETFGVIGCTTVQLLADAPVMKSKPLGSLTVA